MFNSLLDQIPPEACEGHFDDAKKIVLDVTETYYDFEEKNARHLQRVQCRIWLLRVLLLKAREDRSLLEKAKAEVHEFAAAAVRNNWIFILNNQFSFENSGTRDDVAHWIERYVATDEKQCLCFALVAGYLKEILAQHSL